jgi:membrane associated rhomboid family serine protease
MQNQFVSNEDTYPQRYDFVASLATAIIFVIPILIVKWLEIKNDWNLSPYALYPRTSKGIIGIFTFPFLHSDLSHLFSNLSSMFILVGIIRYFFPDMLWRITPLIYLVSGIGTWIIGREAYHIGASGMVYGFGFAVFSAGFISKNWRLLSLSFLMIFLYGSMFWGIFPMEERISWEGHLSGAVGGVLSVFIFRNRLPKPPVVLLDDEEDEDDIEKETKEDEIEQSPQIKINYIYKNSENNKENNG